MKSYFVFRIYVSNEYSLHTHTLKNASHFRQYAKHTISLEANTVARI